jgi:hypothetical protein
MFTNPRGIFSEGYNEFLEYKDKIKSLVIRARDELRGTKLYGKIIDTNNPEDLIACLYILYKDYNSFHERI